jgi:hypothetical protein
VLLKSSGIAGKPEWCVARSSSVISRPTGFGTVPAGSSSRTGSSRLTFPSTTICARRRPVKVLVIDPIW